MPSKNVNTSTPRSATNILSVIISALLCLLFLLVVSGSLVMWGANVSIGGILTIFSLLITVLFLVLAIGLFDRKKWAYKLGFFTCAAGILINAIPISSEDAAKIAMLTKTPNDTWTGIAVNVLIVILIALIYLQKRELEN